VSSPPPLPSPLSPPLPRLLFCPRRPIFSSYVCVQHCLGVGLIMVYNNWKAGGADTDVGDYP
jgi:hypothetical protein